jgi:hypothetical protein
LFKNYLIITGNFSKYELMIMIISPDNSGIKRESFGYKKDMNRVLDPFHTPLIPPSYPLHTPFISKIFYRFRSDFEEYLKRFQAEF